MATLYREFSVETPAEEVWKALADVGSINRLITFLGDVRLEGDERVFAAGDAEVRELSVSVDDEHRRVAYSITQSPFGLSYYHATMQAIPDGDGTRFVWWIDLKPDELASGSAQSLDQAVESIKAALGAIEP